MNYLIENKRTDSMIQN